MFISKKKFNKMNEDIEKLKLVVETLKSCHVVEERELAFGTYLSISHKEQSLNTKAISDLTLSELARYVIDGTPIKRTHIEKVKVTKVFE